MRPYVNKHYFEYVFKDVVKNLYKTKGSGLSKDDDKDKEIDKKTKSKVKKRLRKHLKKLVYDKALNNRFNTIQKKRLAVNNLKRVQHANLDFIPRDHNFRNHMHYRRRRPWGSGGGGNSTRGGAYRYNVDRRQFEGLKENVAKNYKNLLGILEPLVKSFNAFASNSSAASSAQTSNQTAAAPAVSGSSSSGVAGSKLPRVPSQSQSSASNTGTQLSSQQQRPAVRQLHPSMQAEAQKILRENRQKNETALKTIAPLASDVNKSAGLALADRIMAARIAASSPNDESGYVSSSAVNSPDSVKTLSQGPVPVAAALPAVADVIDRVNEGASSSKPSLGNDDSRDSSYLPDIHDIDVKDLVGFSSINDNEKGKSQLINKSKGKMQVSQVRKDLFNNIKKESKALKKTDQNLYNDKKIPKKDDTFSLPNDGDEMFKRFTARENMKLLDNIGVNNPKIFQEMFGKYNSADMKYMIDLRDEPENTQDIEYAKQMDMPKISKNYPLAKIPPSNPTTSSNDELDSILDGIDQNMKNPMKQEYDDRFGNEDFGAPVFARVEEEGAEDHPHHGRVTDFMKTLRLKPKAENIDLDDDDYDSGDHDDVYDTSEGYGMIKQRNSKDKYRGVMKHLNRSFEYVLKNIRNNNIRNKMDNLINSKMMLNNDVYKKIGAKNGLATLQDDHTKNITHLNKEKQTYLDYLMGPTEVPDNEKDQINDLLGHLHHRIRYHFENHENIHRNIRGIDKEVMEAQNEINDMDQKMQIYSNLMMNNIVDSFEPNIHDQYVNKIDNFIFKQALSEYDARKNENIDDGEGHNILRDMVTPYVYEMDENNKDGNTFSSRKLSDVNTTHPINDYIKPFSSGDKLQFEEKLLSSDRDYLNIILHSLNKNCCESDECSSDCQNHTDRNNLTKNNVVKKLLNNIYNQGWI